ncbi:MAG: hypothetical protein ACI8X5_003067 [Planctomycetota bacterium]
MAPESLEPISKLNQHPFQNQRIVSRLSLPTKRKPMPSQLTHHVSQRFLLLASSALLICGTSFLGSCASNSAGVDAQATYPAMVASSLGEMRNVSVTGSVWFGASPSDEDLQLASRRGIERVIDLSTPSDAANCNVAKVCAVLGLEYLMASLNPNDLEANHCVDLVMGWLRNDGGAPTLMFDGSGGRCATYLAIYRSVFLKVPLEEALVEARRAGMKPGEPENFVRAQYDRLSASNTQMASAAN